MDKIDEALELEIKNIQCQSLAQDLANAMFALSYERAKNSVIVRMIREDKESSKEDGEGAEGEQR